MICFFIANALKHSAKNCVVTSSIVQTFWVAHAGFGPTFSMLGHNYVDLVRNNWVVEGDVQAKWNLRIYFACIKLPSFSYFFFVSFPNLG